MKNDITVFSNTIKQSGENIFVKPLCDFFQINYENQCRVISKDRILQTSSTKKSDKSVFGDNIPRVSVSKRGFVRWIQLISPQIVHVDLREKFIDYQIRVFDYLYANTLNILEENKKEFTLHHLIKRSQKVISIENQKIKKYNIELKELRHRKFDGIEFEGSGEFDFEAQAIDQIPPGEGDMVSLMLNNRSYISKFKERVDKAFEVHLREIQNREIEKRLDPKLLEE